MRNELAAFTLVAGLCLIGASGCGGLAVDGEDEAELGSAWEALLADGDVAGIAPSLPIAAPLPQPPSSSCSDCAAQPLAFWSLDDCNAQSTELADSAYS